MKNYPNPEQLQRLFEFAAYYGKSWKQDLLSMWLDGRDANQRDGHLLRQIRNQFGPLWLTKFTLPKDHATAQHPDQRGTFKPADQAPG